MTEPKSELWVLIKQLDNLDRNAAALTDAFERKKAQLQQDLDEILKTRKAVRAKIQAMLNERDRKVSGVASSPPATESQPAELLPRTTEVDTNWPPERIRAMQARLDLDDESFSIRLGVSIATIRAWQNGTSSPQPRNCLALAHMERMAKGRAA